jgi:peptide chain release factor subunit 1
MYGDSFINYGIVLISGKEYRCYILSIHNSHREFKLIKSDTEHLQKKQKKGGQSAPRFGRIRQEKRDIYTKKIASQIVSSYIANNHTECSVKGLIIAGPADIKGEVMEHDIFKQYFQNKVMRVLSSDEINDGTVYDIYSSCFDLFVPYEEGGKIIEEFNDLLSHASDKLTFGSDVHAYLMSNELEKVLVADEIYQEIRGKFPNTKCKFYRVSNNQIKQFGQIVGIKYY